MGLGVIAIVIYGNVDCVIDVNAVSMTIVGVFVSSVCLPQTRYDLILIIWRKTFRLK